MNSYDIGDYVRITDAITQGGNAIDPSTLTLIVRAPDGTSTTYTVAGATITKDSTGNYHVDVAVTMAGIWRYRWTSTGTAAASEEGSFEARSRRVS